MKTRVAIAGVSGRMGRAAVDLLVSHPDFELVAGLGLPGRPYIGKPLSDLSDVVATDDMQAILSARPQILYDVAPGAADSRHRYIALQNQIPVVSGASGLGADVLAKLDALGREHGVPCLVVPNFSIGAVLMMQFAARAARFFDDAEILEIHHARKADAPSGTARHTIEAMAAQTPVFNKPRVQEHETMDGARGARHESGLRVHSMRLPGKISHQEVFLAQDGEMLTIRHESFNTSCFDRGIILSLKSVLDLQAGLHTGLDAILDYKG